MRPGPSLVLAAVLGFVAAVACGTDGQTPTCTDFPAPYDVRSESDRLAARDAIAIAAAEGCVTAPAGGGAAGTAGAGEGGAADAGASGAADAGASGASP